MTAIQAEYVSFKHIKTRKAVVLEMEIPEESFAEVIAVLGMPIGGQSRPVGIALLDPSVAPLKQRKSFDDLPLTQQAVLLSKDIRFWEYVSNIHGICTHEVMARSYICDYCMVFSRSEINKGSYSGDKFIELKNHFYNWKTERNYKDNLDR